MMNDVIQYGSRARALADAVEARITAEELVTGDPLGTLEDLRGSQRLARATVSEAVRILAERGIVEIRPGRGGGVFVKLDAPVVRLRHTFLALKGDLSAVPDALAVRDALEPLIHLDAARHRNANDVDCLRDYVSQLRQCPDTQAFMEINWKLHRRIAEISPNALAKVVYLNSLQIVVDNSGPATPDSEVPTAVWLSIRANVHEELVEAIVAGDTHRTHLATNRHADSSLGESPREGR